MRRARYESKLYFYDASPHHKFLGAGKALIILSLIAATKNEISAPEKAVNDDRPVMTPLSFRHFPSGNFDISRKRFFRGNVPHDPRKKPRVPSLVELMLHRSRTAPYCDIPKSYSSALYFRLTEAEFKVDSLPLGTLLRENVPFYHHYHGDPNKYSLPWTRKIATIMPRQPGPKVMFLTSATLVVVPAGLMSHWERQIMKHCATTLRVLMLRKNIEMPSVKELATDFDVCRILLSWNMDDV